MTEPETPDEKAAREEASKILGISSSELSGTWADKVALIRPQTDQRSIASSWSPTHGKLSADEGAAQELLVRIAALFDAAGKSPRLATNGDRFSVEIPGSPHGRIGTVKATSGKDRIRLEVWKVPPGPNPPPPSTVDLQLQYEESRKRWATHAGYAGDCRWALGVIAEAIVKALQGLPAAK